MAAPLTTPRPWGPASGGSWCLDCRHAQLWDTKLQMLTAEEQSAHTAAHLPVEFEGAHLEELVADEVDAIAEQDDDSPLDGGSDLELDA